MTEYITKEAALYAIGVDRSNWTSPNNAEAWWACGEMRNAIREEIENLPSVSAGFERHGHWIEVRDGILKCSVCDEVDGRMYWSDAYCPHCGAKMDKE